MRARLESGRLWTIALIGVSAVVGCDDEDDALAPTDSPPTVEVTGPAGGTTVPFGTLLEITWTAADAEGPVTVDVYYTADQEAGDVEIATGVEGTSLAWRAPYHNLFGVRFKAVARDSAGQTAAGESPAIFAVVEPSDAGYVGSEVCRTCHATKWSDFQRADPGHLHALSPVVGGEAPAFPHSEIPRAPLGTTWDDLAYVIGGYGRMARFVGSDGYVMTDRFAPGNTQYNLPRPDLAGGLPGRWVPYEKTAAQPETFDCGACHATGWDAATGTFEEPGITCEQCHGPGADHVATKNPSEISLDRTSAQCATCHSRDAALVLASGGFALHNQQAGELALGAHGGELECADCHDPHRGVLFGNAEAGGIVRTCEDCHPDQMLIHLRPVACVTCHMPQATIAARAVHAYQADVRTHVFAIDPSAAAKESLFAVDAASGDTVLTGTALTLDVVCYQCHSDPATGIGGPNTPLSRLQLSHKAQRIHPQR